MTPDHAHLAMNGLDVIVFVIGCACFSQAVRMILSLRGGRPR